MESTTQKWDTLLERLIAEIQASEKVYGTLVQSDRHPGHQPYFNKRFFKQQHSAHLLAEEFRTITGRELTVPKKDDTIFATLQSKLLEQNLSDSEVDVLIIAKEQELVVLYQKVLLNSELPNTTGAILQSQAEEQNQLLHGLRLDYRVNHRKTPNYALS